MLLPSRTNWRFKIALSLTVKAWEALQVVYLPNLLDSDDGFQLKLRKVRESVRHDRAYRDAEDWHRTTNEQVDSQGVIRPSALSGHDSLPCAQKA